jgi:hypothetical protein
MGRLQSIDADPLYTGIDLLRSPLATAYGAPLRWPTIGGRTSATVSGEALPTSAAVSGEALPTSAAVSGEALPTSAVVSGEALPTSAAVSGEALPSSRRWARIR